MKVVIFVLGDFPASKILNADVSERSVCSIFIGGVNKKNNWKKLSLGQTSFEPNLYLH